MPTGLAHGTVTAVSKGAPYEITTLRRDVTTDGRNATVAFTEDWAEDAARRDFRLNALYADAAGTVFDPTGGGLDDAAAGTVTSASYRAGRAVELSTETVTVATYDDPTHWSIVYARTGRDGDADADIRVTETRDGSNLLEIKEVRPAGSNEAWAYRNQTRLSRTAD